MNFGRWLLVAAAVLLFATAVFHASGGAMVAGWLPGARGAILTSLWYVPVVDWSVVGLVWLFVAWRRERRFAPIVWLSALIPLTVAALLIAAVGPGHPGIWMLIGAAALALLGAARLP